MKRILVALIGLLTSLSLHAGIDVPARMRYCGMELEIDDSARRYMEGVIQQITRSPNYYQALLDKSGIFLPFVEEAFAASEVPDDLKYIVIQESAFRADAVSSSNAVGFWQFKEAAAREVGLVMDAQIDERMHIYRASLGAARYFYRLNRDFNNWVYAVIAYNRGPAGAIPFTDAKYYGKREMPITGKTHWYALKAMAFKLMFQHAADQGRPTTWLEPRPTNGETSLEALARANGIDVETLRQHNRWIRGNALPTRDDLVIYVPREGTPVLAQMRHKTQIGSPDLPKDPPPTRRPDEGGPSQNSNGVRMKGFVYLSPTQDPDYNIEYTRAQANQTLVEIAVARDLKPKKLKEWNGHDNAHRLTEGEIVYLRHPAKVKYHIVTRGETLAEIAARHGLEPAKLKARNRMTDDKLQPGQKLYLRKNKPKGEKPIVLEGTATTEEPEEKPAPTKAAPTKATPQKTTPTKASSSKPQEPAANTKVHTVQSGDTLWNISKRYNTSVDAIKRLNSMRSDAVYVGQKLKIPQ